MNGTDSSAPPPRRMPMLPWLSTGAAPTRLLCASIEDRGCCAPGQLRGVIASKRRYAGVPHINHAWQRSEPVSECEIGEPRRERMKTSPFLPGAAVFGRCGGGIARQCHFEREDMTVQRIEISGSYCADGGNPSAPHVICDGLAQPEGEWPRVERGGRDAWTAYPSPCCDTRFAA